MDLESKARSLEAELDAAFDTVSTSPGRKAKASAPSGQPKASSVSTRPVTGLTEDNVEKMAGLVFNTLCRLGRVQECSETELKNFAKGATPFLDRKLGQYMDQNADTVMFVVACGTIALPRIPEAIENWSKEPEANQETTTAEIRESF